MDGMQHTARTPKLYASVTDRRKWRVVPQDGRPTEMKKDSGQKRQIPQTERDCTHVTGKKLRIGIRKPWSLDLKPHSSVPKTHISAVCGGADGWVTLKMKRQEDQEFETSLDYP